MKSAYDIAMERFGGEPHALTEEQKEAIAEIDRCMQASIAETEIMFDQQLAAESDPARASLIQQTRQQKTAEIRTKAEADKERIRST